jgi:hypothetical protein
MEKHYNNSQCFKEKNNKTKFLIGSILKKINIDNFRKKKHQKRGKNHVGNTVAIHSVL